MGIFVLDGVDDVLLEQVGKYLFLVVVIMVSLWSAETLALYGCCDVVV